MIQRHELLYLLPLCLAIACGSNKEDAPKNGTADAKQVTDYPVLTLRPMTINTSIRLPASIQGQQVVEIRPKVDGYIDGIYVSEGAAVRKGQLLFRISNPQYEQALRSAKAGIQSAQADIATAKMSVEKVKPLVDQDIVSKYQLQSAQFTLDAKEAALATAKATLVNAEANVGYLTIHSPADGVVSTIPYKVGALVSSTSTNPLTTLSNTDDVYAYISLDEKRLLELSTQQPGKTTQQKLDALPAVSLVLANGATYAYKGRLQTAAGTIDQQTGSMSVKATFPNKQAQITSGASGTVVIPKLQQDVIVIPQSTTYELQDKRLVYTVIDSNKVKSVAIVTMPTDDGKYFIVTAGLKTGDRIVLSGITGLKNGTAIQPVAANTDSVYKDLAR